MTANDTILRFSARCLSTVRGASAGASTPTPADPSHQPPLWGETPTAASTSESWSWSSPTWPRYSAAWNQEKREKKQTVKYLGTKNIWVSYILSFCVSVSLDHLMTVTFEIVKQTVESSLLRRMLAADYSVGEVKIRHLCPLVDIQ